MGTEYTSATFSRSKPMNTTPLHKFLRASLAAALLLGSTASIASDVTLVPGTDRMGGDYKGFAMDAPEPEVCRQACADDNKCKSFTYVNPGLKGPAAMCFLKSGAPAATADACCASGEKTLAAGSEPTLSSAQVAGTTAGRPTKPLSISFDRRLTPIQPPPTRFVGGLSSATVERITLQPSVQRRINSAMTASRAEVGARYGVEPSNVINLPVQLPGSPMLEFYAAGTLDLNKEPNNIYGYQYCYSVKNTGKAKSVAAKLHVEVEANNNPALKLTEMAGSDGDRIIPPLAPGEIAEVCGGKFFDQLIHAHAVPLADQPRFIAVILGEINDGSAQMLYLGIVGETTEGSASPAPAGAYLSIQPTTSKLDLFSNVVNACFSITNTGDSGSSAAAVKVSINAGGPAGIGIIPIPLLPAHEIQHVVCAPIAITGLKQNKLATVTYDDDLFLNGVISGAVNNGSSAQLRLGYRSKFVDFSP